MTHRGTILAVTHTTNGGVLLFRQRRQSTTEIVGQTAPCYRTYVPVVCVTATAHVSNKGRFDMTAGDGKPCTKCGTSAWYKNGNCKHCSKEYCRQWRQNNLDKSRAIGLRWYYNNKKSVSAYRRRQRRKNPERERRRSRKWARNNPDKNRENGRKWRARKSRARGRFTEDEFRRLCEQYDNRCLCCGSNDVELEADHVIPLSWEGATNDIGNIQPLCKSCNSAKGNHRATDYRTKPAMKQWIQRRLFEEE